MPWPHRLGTFTPPPRPGTLSPSRGARPLGGGIGRGLNMTEGQFATPGPEWVALGSIETQDVLVCKLGNLSPVVVAGGGFEGVGRPLRRGLPTWRGTDVPTLPLSLLMDGHPSVSVEAECRLLQRLAGALLPGDPEPPRLVVAGQMVPAEAKAGGHRWVIAEPPAWDTSPDGVIRRPSDGHRVRQAVDITLMLVSDDADLERVKAPKPKPRYRRVKARQGDTFEKIALRELGSKRYAHKLARLNGKGSGSVSVELRRGLEVKVPTGSLLEDWKRDLKRAG